MIYILPAVWCLELLVFVVTYKTMPEKCDE